MARIKIGHTLATHSFLISKDHPLIWNICQTHFTIKHILEECPIYEPTRTSLNLPQKSTAVSVSKLNRPNAGSRRLQCMKTFTAPFIKQTVRISPLSNVCNVFRNRISSKYVDVTKVESRSRKSNDDSKKNTCSLLAAFLFASLYLLSSGFNITHSSWRRRSQWERVEVAAAILEISGNVKMLSVL
ncbi:Uncharacterized protein FWK35_00012547 [Aphis craccivora]|uniref:RNase H domain-containing protein n=1 Tax=Aphis craccivora TaxID=307492 RepID=A0A6G0ZJD5_APHCR|nr:Uncharacterized protein FWK35_00012547 [Aphis craccivora]